MVVREGFEPSPRPRQTSPVPVSSCFYWGASVPHGVKWTGADKNGEKMANENPPQNAQEPPRTSGGATLWGRGGEGRHGRAQGADGGF